MERAFSSLVEAARRSSGGVLRSLYESAREIEPAIDAAVFFEVRDASLECRDARGERAERAEALALPRSSPALPARVALEAHPLVLATPSERVLPGDASAIAVPVISHRMLHGVWYASSSSARRLGLMPMLATLVACAGEAYLLARERERDRNDATYDALTGVLAPRAFRSLLQELVANAGGNVLSLWFVDTDRFKLVNDVCGHAAGDLVLQRMAALMRAHATEIDVVGRKGGDEFCMLLRGTGKMRAIERARAFRDAVRTCAFDLPVRPTASIGVASFPFDATGAAALLEKADAAMYHAKRCGRDCVAFAVEGAGFALYE